MISKTIGFFGVHYFQTHPDAARGKYYKNNEPFRNKDCRAEFIDIQGTTLDFPRGKSTKGGNLWGIWTQSDDVGEVSELLVVYNDNNYQKTIRYCINMY